MGAEKENILPAVNISKQSNSSDSEEKRLQNDMQVKFESLQQSSPTDSEENRLQNEVKCLCSDGEVMVPLALLSQSKLFTEMTKNCDVTGGPVFHIHEKLNVATFKKVVEWMEHRAGKDEPKIEMDPNTHERKWFKLDDFETKFFEMDANELIDFFLVCSYLQIDSLFLCACQSMAAMLKAKTEDELRQLLIVDGEGVPNEEDKAKIRAKNAWCAY